MIRFENVGMRYGTGNEILKDVSFSLEPGSFHFLTGASGAGKSSLLKLIYLAHRPSRGLVKLFGTDISRVSHEELPDFRQRIGVVFQDFRLINHLSALDNVALPLKVSGNYGENTKRDVIELLRWVGLGDQVHAKPRSMSGGQQQRIAIARAVINNPQVLLADEPTGSVDDEIGMRLLYLFEELNKNGTTIIIATHNDNLVNYFNKPQLHLDNGRLSTIPAPRKIAAE